MAPRVPEYQRDVALRPDYQYSMDVRATPDQMGAAVGRGMQQLGRGLGMMADAVAQVQDLEDTALAKERDNALAEWDRNAKYGEGGFMTLQGKAAVDARADYERRLQEKQRELSDGLRPGAAQKFKAASDARLKQSYESAIIHSANERKTWFKEASASRLQTFADDALAVYGNPEMVKRNLAAGLMELRAQGQLEGWDADTQRLRESEYASGVHKNVTLRLAQDDPLKAEAYMNSVAEGMSEADKFSLRSSLEEPIYAAKGIREAQAILSGASSARDDFEDDSGAVAPSIMDGGADGSLRVEGGQVEWGGSGTTPRRGPTDYGAVNRDIGKILSGVVGLNENSDAAAISSFIKRSAGISIDPRVTPWCAAFVNAVLGAQGIEGTGKLNARSFLNFGTATDDPKAGDIVVFSRGTGGQGHVGFFQGYDANGNILVLGGNQSNSVRVSSYSPDKLLGFRRAGPVNENTAKLPNYSPAGIGAMYEGLSKISDPKLFAATQKALDAQLTFRKKAMDAQQEQVKSWVEDQIAADPALDLMKLPADVRTAIGASGMTTLLNYQEKVRTAGEPTTDERVLYDLQMMEPEELAEADLFQYRDKLSNSDWEKVRGWKQSALGDKRKARDEHLNIREASTQARDQLEAVGIIKTPAKMSDEDHKRVARFNNALTSLMDEFKRENNRVPNQVETQSMINRLLLPVVIQKEKSIWNPTKTPWSSTSNQKGFAFEAPYRDDGTTVDVQVEYADIPIDLRRGISLDLERELGRKPSEDEIVQRYEDFVLSR